MYIMYLRTYAITIHILLLIIGRWQALEDTA